MAREERIMVAVADGKAIALTGRQRGEVWVIDSPPADGFWIIGVAETLSYTESRWRQWSRPTEGELLAYHRYILTLSD